MHKARKSPLLARVRITNPAPRASSSRIPADHRRTLGATGTGSSAPILSNTTALCYTRGIRKRAWQIHLPCMTPKIRVCTYSRLDFKVGRPIPSA